MSIPSSDPRHPRPGLAWLLIALGAVSAFLASRIPSSQPLSSTEIGAGLLLLLAATVATARLVRAARQLVRTRETLAGRVNELHTLHAIGREVLSSMDPARICAAIDRECRKILDVDFCWIALRDRDGVDFREIYRRRGDSVAELEEKALGGGVLSIVARDKRAIRTDDLEALPLESAWRGEPVEKGIRSAMIAPLIVEDRVIGVFSVQSRRTAAYDDHALYLLTTIAQQAAAAVEKARHYRMATVDSLTGFFHRDPFVNRIEEEYRRSRRYGGEFSLLMLDLDGFKAINDRHGHPGGDSYLRAVSGTIREALRGADLACRYGGDEFCLLLPETDLDGAQVIAERIRTAVSNKIVGLDGLAVRSTVSIGLAGFPQHDSGDVRALMRKADEALYRAKREGRNRVVRFAA